MAESYGGPLTGRAASGSATPEPAPREVRPGILATDITQQFMAACGRLEKGDIVKVESFSLYNAVSALEVFRDRPSHSIRGASLTADVEILAWSQIMDPKMDSGCVTSNEDLEEDYDVARELTLSQVLGIIDGLIEMEMAWHSGYPLSQTLLTCVYIEAILKPENIVNGFTFGNSRAYMSQALSVLRGYCLGLLKSTARIIHLVKSEHYYEEEDLITDMYHRSVLESNTSEDILEELALVQQRLSKSADDSDEADEDEAIYEALHVRLNMRISILKAIESVAAEDGIAAMRACWSEGLAAVKEIGTSHHLAEPVEEAFSKKLCRKLASNMPPRRIVQLTFHKAYMELLRLFQDGTEVVDVLECPDAQSIMTFVLMFQSNKPTPPLALSRAILQNLICNQMRILRIMSLQQILDTDFTTILPASPFLDRANDECQDPQDTRALMSLHMEKFCRAAAQPWLDLIRALCQNRCRVRRLLCHVLQSWEILLMEARQTDHVLARHQASTTGNIDAPPMLTAWVKGYQSRMIEWIIELDLELAVYQPDELPGMYDFLTLVASERRRLVVDMPVFVHDEAGEVAVGVMPRAPVDSKYAATFTYLTKLETATKCKMGRALSLLYAVLWRLDLIDKPSRPCGSDALRYELRMRPFCAVHEGRLVEVHELRTDARAWLFLDMMPLELLHSATINAAGARRKLEKLLALTAQDTYSTTCHTRWRRSVTKHIKSTVAAQRAVELVEAAIKRTGEDARGSHKLGIKVEVPMGVTKLDYAPWIVPVVSLLGGEGEAGVKPEEEPTEADDAPSPSG